MAAWLALVAVAMLFIAPVISKSIAHRTACQHTTHTMPMKMSASDMHHVMSAQCEHTSPMEHRMMSGQVMSPMEEIVCGYCQLLVHLPFVQFVLAALLWLLLLFVMRSPLIQIRATPVFRAWSPQRARAPPAVFLSQF